MRGLLCIVALAGITYSVIDWRAHHLECELAYWRNALHGAETQAQADKAQVYITAISQRLSQLRQED
jgi:hypothetical protein